MVSAQEKDGEDAQDMGRTNLVSFFRRNAEDSVKKKQTERQSDTGRKPNKGNEIQKGHPTKKDAMNTQDGEKTGRNKKRQVWNRGDLVRFDVLCD